MSRQKCIVLQKNNNNKPFAEEKRQIIFCSASTQSNVGKKLDAFLGSHIFVLMRMGVMWLVAKQPHNTKKKKTRPESNCAELSQATALSPLKVQGDLCRTFDFVQINAA